MSLTRYLLVGACTLALGGGIGYFVGHRYGEESGYQEATDCLESRTEIPKETAILANKEEMEKIWQYSQCMEMAVDRLEYMDPFCKPEDPKPCFNHYLESIRTQLK